MQVVEKTRRIDATLNGMGLPLIRDAILKVYPKAKIIEDDDEYVDWDDTDIAKEIHSMESPGVMLSAYREREGLTLTALAKMVGTKYTNISAMEKDRRPIGLRMAKKLGEALHVDYTDFLE